MRRLRLPMLAVPALAGVQVLIVQGLGGATSYEANFRAETVALQAAAQSLAANASVTVIAPGADQRDEVLRHLQALSTRTTADDRVLVFLVGHGSMDGENYKFNVGGPDLGARELATALDALPARLQLLVATGSSSGALQQALKSSRRVVITATRNGNEQNATRFGIEFAAALQSEAADSDKDGRISAQEAFTFADRQVKDYYTREVRLATEHAQLSGEGAAQWPLARLASATAQEAAAGDPATAARRSELNAALDALRLRKAELGEQAYNAELERLLLELATLEAGDADGGGAP